MPFQSKSFALKIPCGTVEKRRMEVKAKAEKGFGYAYIFQSQGKDFLMPSTAVTKSRMKGNFHVRFGSGGETRNLSPTITNNFHLSRENPSSILSI
jgi:hypothetical protein